MASASRPSVKERTRERGPAESAPSRIIIEGVSPEIDGGSFPIKRVDRRGGRGRRRTSSPRGTTTSGPSSSLGPSARRNGPRRPMTRASERPMVRLVHRREARPLRVHHRRHGSISSPPGPTSWARRPRRGRTSQRAAGRGRTRPGRRRARRRSRRRLAQRPRRGPGSLGGPGRADPRGARPRALGDHGPASRPIEAASPTIETWA